MRRRREAAAKPASIVRISVTDIARGITWNRSLGTGDGPSGTGSVPSTESMISRPPWKTWPMIAAPSAWTASARRR